MTSFSLTLVAAIALSSSPDRSMLLAIVITSGWSCLGCPLLRRIAEATRAISARSTETLCSNHLVLRSSIESISFKYLTRFKPVQPYIRRNSRTSTLGPYRVRALDITGVDPWDKEGAFRSAKCFDRSYMSMKRSANLQYRFLRGHEVFRNDLPIVHLSAISSSRAGTSDFQTLFHQNTRY